jgi:methylmalonyl-CoA mutase cobalamin-binding subunit
VVSSAEKRAAESLANLLGPKPRVITCKTCGIAGHNSRTCGKSPVVSSAEKRAAESLANLLGPKPRVITCKTCGIAGHNSKTCGNHEHPEPVKQVSLQGVTMFNEPKGYYTAGTSPEVKQVSLQGVTMFNEPKGYSSVNAKRMAHESHRKITCQKCGCEGHNSRTCFMNPPTSNGVAVVASTAKRTAATKRLEDRIVEDFNPTNGDMKSFLLEQCKIWLIET